MKRRVNPRRWLMSALHMKEGPAQGSAAVQNAFESAQPMRAVWGIEDPLTDFIAGSGQRHHMINIQIVQAARNLCAQTLLSQKIPIRARGRCKSARHPNARLRQLTDHFSQRSIFAADRGD